MAIKIELSPSLPKPNHPKSVERANRLKFDEVKVKYLNFNEFVSAVVIDSHNKTQSLFLN